MTIEPMFEYCPTCRRECLTELPPCADGHDDRCPDRACVECGTALLVDAPLFAITPARGRPRGARRPGRSGRHAA